MTPPSAVAPRPGPPAQVTVVFLGGTIGMTSEPGRGASPTLGSADLLGGLGLGGLRVEAVDLLNVGSSHLTSDHLLRALAAADRAVDAGARGVVIVQGTDSMEETAYLWDLLWAHDAPLVVTGAMRHPGLPGADGPANLTAAITAAADRACRGLGVLVLLGDELHAARYVAKQHTSLPSAFCSPGVGPVGRMLEGRPVIPFRPARRPALAAPEAIAARVPLLTATVDDDPALYRAAAAGADGLVVAGFGAGHVRADVADVLAGLVAEMPVVLTSRAGAGSVHTHTYGGVGSEEDLLGRGLVNAGHLVGLKARLLLRVLLAGGTSREDVHAAFATHGSA